MTIRATKLIFVFAMAVFALITAANNVNDYFINLDLVEKVVSMTTILPNSNITYRAIQFSFFHHFSLVIIIIMQILTGLYCLVGFSRMRKALRKSAAEFNRSKKTAIIGLSIGFLGFQILFVTIGGVWFGMWMSQMVIKVMQAAFEIFITFLIVLVYVAHKDDELEKE